MRVLLPEVSKRGSSRSGPNRICLLRGLSLSHRERTGEQLAIHGRKPHGESEFRAVCRERRIWFAAQTRSYLINRPRGSELQLRHQKASKSGALAPEGKLRNLPDHL